MSSPANDDRAEIDRRFADLMASLNDDSAAPDRPPREHPRRPEPRDIPKPLAVERREPFSLDAAMADAEPDDEPLELPPLPPVAVRPGLVVGFCCLGVAILLAVLAMVGVELGHDLGVAGAGFGVIGLVVLLLNTRRGPRDDSHDYDPRDGSRL